MKIYQVSVLDSSASLPPNSFIVPSPENFPLQSRIIIMGKQELVTIKLAMEEKWHWLEGATIHSWC